MTTTSTYHVDGMTCGHCVASVIEGLSAVPGVTDVVVDLASGQVEVVSDAPLDADTVRVAVAEAGYEVKAP